MQEPEGIERCKNCDTPTWLGRDLCDGCLIAELERALADMTAERDMLLEILQDVWEQFSIRASDGCKWAGGLSVLEDVQRAIDAG